MSHITLDFAFCKEFPWGVPIRIHTLGKYDILEFKKWMFKDGRQMIPRMAEEKSTYHAYISGQDIGQSYSSLEKAIIGAIAYHYDGCNSQAGALFERMIQIS